MDDCQLLKQYASEKSEKAFRTLVDRYAGMVYHAALRQTGHPHTAEEAAQTVFVALAQKAGRIPRRATLHGWLFQATRFAVLNQARANANRQRREQEAVVMQPAIETNETDSAWEQITPHLNDALDKLSAADREALMIRYFDNKSHKDVAAALDISEETARKRISWAIEKLRVIFAKRGIVVSSLVLTAAFAAHGAKAAPVGASSWASVAMTKAAAGTAATSASGTLAVLTVAKAAVITLIVLGGAAFAIFKSTTHNQPVTALASSPAQLKTNGSLAGPVAPPKPAAKTNPASSTALDKVTAALHDPNPTDAFPNSVMQEAIAGLGDNKKVALPILEAAVTNADTLIRLRAIDGLGIIGPPAGEAAPLILDILRQGGLGQAIPGIHYLALPLDIYTDNILFYTLGQIRPGPEILPEFAQILKNYPFACHLTHQVVRQVRNTRRTLPAGGWLWEIAGENPKALNDAFRPLLQDQKQMVRGVAALALVSALGDQADQSVFPVAAELLKSDDDSIMRPEGMSLLTGSTRDLSQDGPPGKDVLYAPRLGPHLNETVSALADAACHSTRQSLRLQAAKMLDVLVPDFGKANPLLAAAIEKEKQSGAFVQQVQSGELPTTEMVKGLKKYPKAAPFVASYFARKGSNVIELLPALNEALTVLAPAPDSSPGDRQEALNLRKRLADSIQEIAPELPKPLFTDTDTLKLNQIMADPALQADPDRFQKVSAARQSAEWTEPRSSLSDHSPDQVRHLLSKVKDADSPTYDALAAKVKEIDPHFFDALATPTKEN